MDKCFASCDSGSSCCSRAWRTVRERQADCPRGVVHPGVLLVLREFVFRFISTRRVGGFRLEEVGRTVCLGWPDRSRGSDRPRCSLGLSVIRCALLEVRFSFSDRQSVTRGPSARTTLRNRMLVA
jgi:hypothetical protein